MIANAIVFPVKFNPQHWLFYLYVTTAADAGTEESLNKLEKISFWGKTGIEGQVQCGGVW